MVFIPIHGTGEASVKRNQLVANGASERARGRSLARRPCVVVVKGRFCPLQRW